MVRKTCVIDAKTCSIRNFGATVIYRPPVHVRKAAYVAPPRKGDNRGSAGNEARSSLSGMKPTLLGVRKARITSTIIPSYGMPPYSRGCERTFQRVQEMKMTVGGGSFSPEEIKYLKSLPAVAEATSKRITYTDDFKRYFLTRYNKGASPVRLFREAGLDPALIGYKRIERCLARWREAQDEILGAEASEPAQPWGGGISFEALSIGNRWNVRYFERVARGGECRDYGESRQRIRFLRIPRTPRHHLPHLPQRAEQRSA